QANTQETRPLFKLQWKEKYGYIDKTGKVVTPPQYDFAGSYGEGLAAVAAVIESGGTYVRKWGYIDKAGNVVIPLQFDGAGAFSEGLAPVQTGGKWNYINKAGKVVIPLQFDG